MITRRSALLSLDWKMLRFFYPDLFSPIQAFRRWMWTRCAGCGKPFPFRNWPTFDGYVEEYVPPRWFKGEERMYHSKCYTLLRVSRLPAEEK